MKQSPHKTNLNFKSPALWAATWFGCGLMRPAPGTWGSLGALPFAIFLMLWGGLPALLLGALLLFPLGVWSAGKFDTMNNSEDSSEIVIDEVVGVFIALLPMAAAPTALGIGLGFILFRGFDILKPFPVNWLEKTPGGAMSVMLDDVMAGLYAAIILWGAQIGGFIG